MPVEEMSENTVAEDAPEKEVPESEEAEDAAISQRDSKGGGCRFLRKLMGEDLVADYTRSQDSEEEIIVEMMVCQRIRLLSMMMMIQRMKHQKLQLRKMKLS